jgi:hypothetical protein
MSLAEKQVIDFEKNLRKALNRFQAEIVANARSGYMFSQKADERIRYASELYDGILQGLRDSGYYGVVSDLIEKDRELISEVRILRSANKLPSVFTKSSAETFNALRNMEFAQFDNIGKGFVASLSQELTNYVVSGISEIDFMMAIRESLDNKFAKYARTYAITSRAQFVQAVQDEAAKNYEGEVYWVFEGPEDDKTRPACQEGLAKEYFTDEERIAFEAETADERAWNCRHTFQQVTKEDYEENKHGS